MTIPGLRPPANTVKGSSQNLGDIKLVQEYPKPEMFTFAVAQEFYYTDNVFFTHDNPLGSSAYLGTYTASFVPYSLRDWTPRITAQYNMQRYDTVPLGDFDNERLAVSSTYTFGKNRDWSWISGVVLSRYTLPHQNDHEFFREAIYDNQVSRVQQLGSDLPLFFIATYELAYHQASPDFADYISNGLTLDLDYSPIPVIGITSYVTPTLRNFLTNSYFQNDRNDLHLAAGFDIKWQTCKYVSFDASFYHVSDYSNNPGLSFNYTLPGVILTGQVAF